MKYGDLLLLKRGAHSYHMGWKRGDGIQTYPESIAVIFLSLREETGTDPRTFYEIITPMGMQTIYSGFCSEVQDEA